MFSRMVAHFPFIMWPGVRQRLSTLPKHLVIQGGAFAILLGLMGARSICLRRLRVA